MMDYDTWFFEVWEQGENAGTIPEGWEYNDYLNSLADDLRKYMREQI